MKINELMIYGYGKFENQNIQFNNTPIQVLYGENEAGKSTIMSFIHSILFGFPTKQQKEKRYEPKQGGKYGGSITLTLGNESIRVERIDGKATGDVVVYTDKGQTGSELELKGILKGIDKKTYQAIFSFDLHGLQNVFELNREALGKYLFLSTIFGSDALYFLQDQLGKKKELLYKPNGRKPKLNQMIEELKKDYNSLLQAKVYENEYHELLLEKNELTSKLEEIRLEKINLHTKLKQLEKIKNIAPLIKQKESCENAIKELPDPKDFPENGPILLEQLLAKLQPIEGKLKRINEKKEALQKARSLHVNEDIFQDFQAFLLLKEDYPLIRQYKEEERTIGLQIEQLQERIKEELHYLFGENDATIVEEIKTTMVVKEQLKEATKEHQQLIHQKQLLDEQFERAKDGLENSEKKLLQLRSLSIDELEYNKLITEEKQLEKRLKDISLFETKKEENERLLEQMKKREKWFQKKKKIWYQTTLVSIIISIASSIAFMMFDLAYFSIMFIPVLLFLLIFRPKKDEWLLDLKEQQRTLQQYLYEYENVDIESRRAQLKQIQDTLAKEEQLKQQIELEQMNVKQKEEAYDRIINQFEAWENKMYHLMEKLNPIYQILKASSDLSVDLLLERYEMIAECQKRIKEKKHLEERINHIQNKIHQFKVEIMNLADKYHVTSTKQLEVIVSELNRTLEKEIETQKEFEQVKKEWNDTKQEWNHIKQEIEMLLKKAKVQTEEEFRQKATFIEKRLELEKQLRWIKAQLEAKGAISFEVNNKEMNLDDVNREESKLEIDLQDYGQKEESYQKRLAEINIQLKQIEDSGTYSKLKYQFEIKRSQVKEMAKKWAIYAVSEDLLTKTIDYHRAHRMPLLLKKAEEYFRFLTYSRYTNIYIQEETSTLLVKTEDGKYFQAEELSQGTAEQLYVAIRFALVELMSNRINLPILIDDSFVNFDHKRLERTIQLIRKLSNGYQVLLFTCHRHIVSAFDEREVYFLNKNEQFEQMKRGFING